MDFNKWIELPITDADREKATETALKRREYMRRSGYAPNFQSDALTNEVNGLLGEIKVAQFLGLEPNLRTDAPGSVDFIVGGYIIDVKTATTKTHPSQLINGGRGFLINKSQYHKHTETNIYLSALIWGSTLWVCGYVTRDAVTKYPEINPGFAPCYAVPIPSLSPADALLGGF